MYEAAVLATVIVAVVAAVDYVYRAWVRQTNPVPATWILMMVVMSLSLWMYWNSPQKSWTSNIGFLAGFVSCAIILLGVISTHIRYGTLSVAFDKVQKWCLAAGGAVVVFWFFTQEPLVSYTLVQLVALVAYFATVKRLWRAKQSTEPLLLWVAGLMGNIFAIYPAWAQGDPFSWIYLARALPCSILLLFLIGRIKRRSARAVLAY